MSGLVSYRSGLAAESLVERHYVRAGSEVAARRWRGTSGEIDLILRQGRELVFVEVKKSRSFARAAERLSRAQIKRILATATEFLAGEPAGQDSDVRFDVALVNGSGQLDILQNALCA